MKQRGTIIQICGARGLLFMAFIAVCLVAGFVAFPALALMRLWNMVEFLPAINIYQGGLLWAIVAMSVYLTGKYRISMKPQERMTEEELEQIIENIRLNSEKE